MAAQLGRLGMSLLVICGGTQLINDISVQKNQEKGYKDFLQFTTGSADTLSESTIFYLVCVQALLMLVAGLLFLKEQKIGSYLYIAVIVI